MLITQRMSLKIDAISLALLVSEDLETDPPKLIS